MPKSTPPDTFGQEMFSSTAAMPARPSSRRGHSHELVVRAAGDADDDRHAERRQVRQMVRDERLDAVVVQADRVEHAGGGFDRSPRRVAGARLLRDRLGQDAAEPAEVDQAFHLAGVAERAGGDEDRIRQPQPAELDGEIDRRCDVVADGIAAIEIECGRIASGIVVATKFSVRQRWQFAIPRSRRPAKSTVGLDNAAVRAERRHVARLIEEPDAFPFVEERRRSSDVKINCLRTPGRVGRVHRNEAAGAGGQPAGGHECQKYLTHSNYSSLSIRPTVARSSSSHDVHVSAGMLPCDPLSQPARTPTNRTRDRQAGRAQCTMILPCFDGSEK